MTSRPLRQLSSLGSCAATSHRPLNRAKNPDLFPKYMHKSTLWIMGLIGRAIWSKQLTKWRC